MTPDRGCWRCQWIRVTPERRWDRISDCGMPLPTSGTCHAARALLNLCMTGRGESEGLSWRRGGEKGVEGEGRRFNAFQRMGWRRLRLALEVQDLKTANSRPGPRFGTSGIRAETAEASPSSPALTQPAYPRPALLAG